MLIAISRFARAAVACLLLLQATSRADLTVNSNLGELPLGVTHLMGDTAEGANNADFYTNSVTSDGNWGNELVYQFQLGEPLLVDLTLSATNGDPDFFLLTGLATAASGGKNAAQDDVDALFLDDPLPDTSSFGLLPSGTYYLSIDAFGNLDPPPAVAASATFDLDITTTAAVPPPVFVDLGPIAAANEPLTIDSLGSDFDTILGLFDSDGFLLDVNDDVVPNVVLQSELDLAQGLPQGQYFLALGGFFSAFDDGFLVLPDPDSEGGNYILNYPAAAATGALATEEVQWFHFEVAVPEPSAWVLAVIGMSLLAVGGRIFTARGKRISPGRTPSAPRRHSG
jgi:hypothetical protein